MIQVFKSFICEICGREFPMSEYDYKCELGHCCICLECKDKHVFKLKNDDEQIWKVCNIFQWWYQYIINLLYDHLKRHFYKLIDKGLYRSRNEK
jgi:hypothetical protein